MTPVLNVQGMVKRFGGLLATDHVDLDRQAGRDPRPDRPQWRRQDDR
jgi:hypothetical protein